MDSESTDQQEHTKPLQLIIATNRCVTEKKHRLQLEETLDNKLTGSLHLLHCVFKAKYSLFGDVAKNNTNKLTIADNIAAAQPVNGEAKKSRKRQRLARASKLTAKRWATKFRTWATDVPGMRLVLIPENEHHSFLQARARANNGAPWLFFLHGNNQTLSDTVAVCRQLQVDYGVNIFLFSWPSRTYNPRSVPHLLASALMMAHPATRLVARLTALKSVYDRHEQYKQARGLADKTLPALRCALQLFTKNLMFPLQRQGVPVNLLVHSLGHYLLLQLALSKLPAVAGEFGSTLFHQADIDVDELAPLVSGLPFINPQTLYITHNKKDYALFLSGLWNNRLKPNKAYSRLGNGVHNQPPVHGKLLDLTGLPGVSMNHAMVWQKNLSPEIKAQFYRVLNHSVTETSTGPY